MNVTEGRPRRRASEVAKTKINEYYKVNKHVALKPRTENEGENVLKVKTKQARKNLGKKTADVSTKATLHVPEESKTLASEGDCEQINKLAEKSISAGCASPVKKTPPRQPIQNEPLVVFGNWQLALALAQSAERHPLAYKMIAAQKSLIKAKKITLFKNKKT